MMAPAAREGRPAADQLPKATNRKPTGPAVPRRGPEAGSPRNTEFLYRKELYSEKDGIIFLRKETPLTFLPFSQDPHQG